MLSHGFTDQYRCGPAGNIFVTKITATQDRGTHGAHIAGADEAHVHFRLIRHRHDRSAFDCDRLMRTSTE